MTLVRTISAVTAISIVSVGVFAGAARSPDGAPVPDRLADSTFWRLVNEISEPGGYFRSDNFVSNEGELQYVINDLQRTVPKRRAYMGVGPEQNLTYIAALDPAIVFIVDIRRQNLVHHLMFKSLMETSPDRVTYVSRLLSRPAPAGLDTASTVVALFNAFLMVPADSAMYRATLATMSEHLTKTHGFALADTDLEGLRYIFGAFAEAGASLTYSFGQMNNRRFGGWMPTLAEMMTETDEQGVHRGYLASEANFRAVKSLHERNLIVPVVGDFGGPKAIRAVGDWLRAHDTKVGVFYASNVEQYLFEDPAVAAAFYANLATLPTDSLSTFVRSVSSRGWVPRRNPNSRLAQITMGIEPMLTAIREGRVANYMELVMLRP
jgi:hypothetical protein